MATLRLLNDGIAASNAGTEVLTCAFTPDGAYVVSGGWDGLLRLWESSGGAQVSSFQVSPKPVSACTVSLDGKLLVSGSLDGMLGIWDALTHERQHTFLAHTRPISAIVYSPDGKSLVTASWDGSLMIWDSIKERAGRNLVGHSDIVAGCRFTPDGLGLLSWSHDRSIRLWDVGRGRVQNEFTGHGDRVNACALSPDGSWAVSGGRDGTLKAWDLKAGEEVGSIFLPAEIRSCLFLLDGESAVVVDATGRLTLHAVPSLEEQTELATELAVQCADLSSSGSQIVLGSADGQVRFLTLDGCDDVPLVVMATHSMQRTASALQKLFGKSKMVHRYRCTCPACRHSFELANGSNLGQPAPCPHCRRNLKVSAVARMEQ